MIEEEEASATRMNERQDHIIYVLIKTYLIQIAGKISNVVSSFNPWQT